MDTDPASLQTHPGILTYEGTAYSCRVRYRGSTTLNLPKRSWKIYFDNDGPEGLEETNLNAEYRDISLCRNYLCMALSRTAGLPTPDTRFVSFIVNGEYRGVHHEIEQVDDTFFKRRDLGDGCTFKAISHGARFAPPLYSEKLTIYNQPKSSLGASVDTLGARFAFIQHATPDEVSEEIDKIVDGSNVMAYFALQYAIGNNDGFSKNYFLHLRDDGRYVMVPWDCDATLGNNWLGIYLGQVNRKSYSFLGHQAIFQRLLSVPQYRSVFFNKLNTIVSTGFSSVSDIAIEVYDQIRHDIYLDTYKKGSNEEFDQELTAILDFMNGRSGYLYDLDWFHRIELTRFTASPDYISSGDDLIHFEAELEEQPHSVLAVVIDTDGIIAEVELFDDGTSGDVTAGDLIYSADAAFPELQPPLYYGFLPKPNSSEGYPTPPAGWHEFGYYPLSLPSIQLNSQPPALNDAFIESFYFDPGTGTHYFVVRNMSNRIIDFSGCVIRLGRTHRLLRLPPMNDLNPAETFFVTNHYDWLTGLEPDSRIIGGFYFQPMTGDTVYIETSSGSIISSRVVPDVNEGKEFVGTVVINEINYHSSDDFDPGDWIELYAHSEIEDLSGWTLRDSRYDHKYTIPEEIALPLNEYLIIASDTTSFKVCFPHAEDVIGGFYFGFSGGGEDIRLHDAEGNLVDWVSYDDNLPWPEEADGDGNTLELTNPALPNYNAEYWLASSVQYSHGTPGVVNSVYEEIPDTNNLSIPDTWELISVYPNPSNSQIKIKFSAPEAGDLRISIFDIMGRKIAHLEESVSSAGFSAISWNGKNLNGVPVSSGIYFIQIEANDLSSCKKAVLIK